MSAFGYAELIEALRVELVMKASEKGSFTDESVVRLSQFLDQILNDFERKKENASRRSTLVS